MLSLQKVHKTSTRNGHMGRDTKQGEIRSFSLPFCTSKEPKADQHRVYQQSIELIQSPCLLSRGWLAGQLSQTPKSKTKQHH